MEDLTGSPESKHPPTRKVDIQNPQGECAVTIDAKCLNLIPCHCSPTPDTLFLMREGECLSIECKKCNELVIEDFPVKLSVIQAFATLEYLVNNWNNQHKRKYCKHCQDVTPSLYQDTKGGEFLFGCRVCSCRSPAGTTSKEALINWNRLMN